MGHQSEDNQAQKVPIDKNNARSVEGVETNIDQPDKVQKQQEASPLSKSRPAEEPEHRLLESLHKHSLRNKGDPASSETGRDCDKEQRKNRGKERQRRKDGTSLSSTSASQSDTHRVSVSKERA